MALLGRDDPRVLLMTATMPVNSMYIFLLWKLLLILFRMIGGKSPHRTPIVGILWISVGKGHNDPPFVLRPASHILLLNLDAIIVFTCISRRRLGRFRCAIAICGESVSTIPIF